MKPRSFYIITGGPGVGKTSLIEALRRKGFAVVPEDARRIIKEQMELGEDGLPWKDKVHYAELMYEAAINSYKGVSADDNSSVHFFDRGLLDTICYMRMQHIAIPDEMSAQVAKLQYANSVFILPPWQEIYQTDAERKQDWEEAVFTFQKMKETYSLYGYTIVELPKTSVANRVAFILNYMVTNRAGDDVKS